MRAAGRGGIPCSFVVDKAGKIAYIGHPMHLDAVLPQVVAGTWDPVKGSADLEAAEKDFGRAYSASQDKDPAAGLKTFEEVIAAHPTFVDVPYLLGPRLDLLVKNKKFADAQKAGEAVLAKAAKRDDVVALRTLRGAFLSDPAKGETKLVGLAVKAAEMDRAVTGADDAGATVRLAAAYTAAGETDKGKKVAIEGVALAQKALKGDKDWQGQLLLASAHDAAGEKDGAKAAAEKAIAAAGDQRGIERVRRRAGQEVRRRGEAGGLRKEEGEMTISESGTQLREGCVPGSPGPTDGHGSRLAFRRAGPSDRIDRFPPVHRILQALGDATREIASGRARGARLDLARRHAAPRLPPATRHWTSTRAMRKPLSPPCLRS